MSAPDFFEQRKAREWLRSHDLRVRLPRPGRRLLIHMQDLAGGAVVIERVEHHVEGQVLKRYLICTAGVPR